MDEGDFELCPCRCCGRNFRPDVLRKHEPICIKSSKKQRKIFDSGKQRADGSDIPLNKTLRPGEIPRPDPKVAAAEAKTKQWRQKHEMLISSFKAARNYAVAKSTGGPLPPPPPPVIDSSLVQCPYCQRRFNEEACTRHVPFCKERQSKLPSKSNTVNKKPIYKAPAMKSRQPVPVQKGYSTSPSENYSQSSISTQNHSTRAGMSSNIPAKSTKSSLPTRNVVGRPQQSPTGVSGIVTNHQPISATGGYNNRTTSYNNSATASRTHQPVKTSATPTSMSTKSGGLRRPVVGAGAGAGVGSGATANTPGSRSTGFCHECGASFSVATARFCSECGVRRFAV